MFCPDCKTEYREGFAKCSDCGAALVENLGDSSANVDGMELVWAGNDPRIFHEYRNALQAAAIAFADKPPGPRLLYTSLRPPMEIWTYRRDHEAVKKVREGIVGDSEPEQEDNDLGSDPQFGSFAKPDSQKRAEPFWMRAWTATPIKTEDLQEQGTPELGSVDEPEELPSGDDFENFYSEDATAEVWFGEVAMAQMFESCLRENGIACVIVPKGNATAMLVLPQREARAKEIIREIIEATPPE